MNELWNLLNKPEYNGREVIDFLSGDPELKTLFASSAGVWEGFTIQEHTLMVYAIFADQFEVYKNYYHFKTNSDVRLFPTLKFAIALHDIGKPYAVQAGDKGRQHEFTIPILEKFLKIYGFSKEETNLLKALIGHDVMGEYVKGRIDVETAKEKMNEIAQEAGMSLIDFLPLQFLFYTFDAAAYPSLRQRIFTKTEEGLLIPNQSQFENLWNAVKLQ